MNICNTKYQPSTGLSPEVSFCFANETTTKEMANAQTAITAATEIKVRILSSAVRLFHQFGFLKYYVMDEDNHN